MQSTHWLVGVVWENVPMGQLSRHDEDEEWKYVPVAQVVQAMVDVHSPHGKMQA